MEAVLNGRGGMADRDDIERIASEAASAGRSIALMNEVAARLKGKELPADFDLVEYVYWHGGVTDEMRNVLYSLPQVEGDRSWERQVEMVRDLPPL